ncbi:MAG: flagellar motor switch protein FliM [Marmoricola sp.]|nr:flagellar motor switch protein FliM [Marmoricola sp.]
MPVDSTGVNPPSEAVAYDFRRPIQLSREHARILQVGFDSFARQATTLFTSTLRTVCSMNLLSVEQQNYGEYVEGLLAPTYMTIFTADPLSGRGVLEMPVKAAMTCIDHILGGPGSALQPLRALSEIESTVMTRLTERLLAEMRYSLGNVLDFTPAISSVEYSPMFVQLAAASDVMAVATFDLRIDDRPYKVSTCLPFSDLLPYLVAAAAPAPVSDRERATRARSAELLREQFQSVPVDLAVRFRTTRVSPDALGDLAVGDVIRLSHPATAPLDVTTDEAVFAHATPGSKGPKLAALVVGAPKEDR